MIQAIKPTARENYDRAYKWEKDEENRFAQRLARMPAPRRRWDDKMEEAAGNVANFDNPAFNIIAGQTNYALLEIASETAAEQAVTAPQLDLFQKA